MTDKPLPTSRSGRIVKRKCFDDFQKFEDGSKISSDEKYKKTRSKPIRRTRCPEKEITTSKKQKKYDEIPTDYKELKEKTDAGDIPDTIYYRATSNSMYIPSITADMIRDDGKDLTVQTSSKDYFKYARVRQTTKNDHAEPDKVMQVIEAIRKRPIIWDQRLVCHQNMSLVRRAWQQLEVELGVDDEYPLARRKQIWKSKKDYFAFAVNSDSLSKWAFASAMEFYLPMVNFRTKVCLRPTVSSDTPSSSSSSVTSLHDKLILADKNIQCSPFDKTNVLTFLLKSLHDIGMANGEMMERHGQKILDVFRGKFEATIATKKEEQLIDETNSNS